MSELGALRELTFGRVRVMLREPEVLFWIFLFPILLAFGIGIAFSDPAPESFRIGIEEGSPGQELFPTLAASPDLQPVLLEEGTAGDELRRGGVSAVLDIGEDGVIELRFDPARPQARTARILAESALQQAAGGATPLEVREELVTARGQRYIDWLIPGLIGFNLMGTGLWSVAFYTTQVRESRELRRLIATPMRRSHFLLSQILARYAFLVAEIPLIILFAWFAFGVPVEGSFLALSVLVLLGATCFAGMGLLAASRVRTTEGVSGIINLIMMPMLILSGVFFSVDRFPDVTQPLIQLLPLTALIDALRAVYNEGLGLAAVPTEIAILTGWTLAAFLVALRIFRWQ